MLIGIDSSPCSLSLRNRSTLCSTTKCHQNKSDLKNVFVQNFFFNIFYSFNPNHAYWNQRRLFSGNLPGMFRSFSAQNGAIFHVFVIFLVFCLISLRLKFLEFDEGLLRDIIICYDPFMSYMFLYYKHEHTK